MKPEETIDFHIRWAWHKISRLYNVEAQRHGFSMSAGYVLLNVDKEGTPSTALGPKMGMEPRSLTRILKRMEEAGLICRKPDETDGRKVLILLTDEGREMRKSAKDAVVSFNEQLRHLLSDEELRNLLRTMSKINDILDNQNFFEKE